MKKNLIYLFMALFAVTFMTACGDDKDDSAADVIANASGTYTKGKVAIYILGEPINNWSDLSSETPDIEVDKNLNVELAGDGSAAINLTIKDLDIADGSDPNAILTLSVPGVPVTVADESIIVNSTDKKWSVPIVNGLDADVNTIIGTIKDNKIDLQLSAWQGTLQQYVYISVVVSK